MISNWSSGENHLEAATQKGRLELHLGLEGGDYFLHPDTKVRRRLQMQNGRQFAACVDPEPTGP